MSENENPAKGKENQDSDPANPDEGIQFAHFLTSVSPSQLRTVKDVIRTETARDGSKSIYVCTPEIRLHCDHELCGGERTFRHSAGETRIYNNSKILERFLQYKCSNCEVSTKRYSLYIKQLEPIGLGIAYKYGELPSFGPPTPPRLLRMLGDTDKELFLRGRRCESQGLGIGAFTYYRRVVENRKSEIIAQIRKVAEAVSAPTDLLEQLRMAEKEVSFSKAVEDIKDAIPQSILLNGHNPLTLLHRALSAGLHEESDEKCLQLAHDVRVVLIELAEKVTNALKDEKELNDALARLMSATNSQSKKGGSSKKNR